MVKLKALPNQLSIATSQLAFAGDGGQKQYDRDRKASAPWRNWYNLKAWSDARITQFKLDRFTCRMCGKIDGNTSRLICDHIKPHRGNKKLFWDPNNHQTLCKPCHDGEKQRQEQGQ